MTGWLDLPSFRPNSTGGTSLNAVAVPLDKSTGTFSHTHRPKLLTGPNHTIWHSADLAAWTDDATTAAGVPTGHAEVETLPVTLTNTLITIPKLFIRVRADRNRSSPSQTRQNE